MSDYIDAGRNNAPIQSAVPLRKMIYDELMNDIMCGTINAGERLSETALVERFGVSKTPIREALIQMEREGFILLRKNAGAVVQKTSIRMVKEIFTIIAVLESYAAETVVAEKKITNSDIAYLAKLIQSMREKAQQKKYLEYRSLNAQFHEYFVERLGNETLKKNVTDLRKRMYGFISGGLTLPLYIDRYVECHRQILNAIKKNDAMKAAILMRKHIMELIDFLVSTLSR